MEMNSPPTCPNTVTIRRNPPRSARPTATAIPISSSSSTVPEVRSFPTEEILSMDLSNPESQNLKVFLRIRPLLLPTRLDQNPKPKFKNVWPQNPAKKNSGIERPSQKKKKNAEVCVRVNSSQSVTLSPPPVLQDSNRTKTEVYDGFSHVFSPDSPQEEVYERMMRPLVEDFMRGKSGMLAALGPSGSGKTHTVFGCPRQPGMVPLALKQIFKRTPGCDTQSVRSFFISIFEISSERGKGEMLVDLSPNGGDLSMQQSTLKGLQEVAISDARHAESIIAQAMLKRATATTNSNSQSSRSQCIINIRGVAEKFKGEDIDQANDGVLSIVDLAGAEREKRTGNQGTRLLESSFINNTSMVFGLCLRSLLEHQKNPKKPLQKHFQNSLLTKYLRDYLEGKKRMALILTVKSGEEDYRDTSYMLRQASPYMEIKYDNVAEPSNTSYNKRHFQALPRSEQHKRMKFTGSDTYKSEGKSTEAENESSEGGSIKSSGCVDGFSLEDYKEKLKVADNVICHLRESLMIEQTRYLELEKELKDIKSFCSCSHGKSVEVSSVEVDTNFKERVPLDGHDSSNVDEQTCESLSISGHSAEDLRESECVRVEDSCPSADIAGFMVTSSQSLVMHRKDSCSSVERDQLLSEEDEESSEDVAVTGHCDADDLLDGESRLDTSCRTLQLENSERGVSPTLSPSPNDSSSPCDSIDVPASEPRVRIIDDIPDSEPRVQLPPSGKDFSAPSHIINVPDTEPRVQLSPSSKEASAPCEVIDLADSGTRVQTCTKAEKPKRRLLPASSILLRDLSIVDIEDDNEKPKGRKKSAAKQGKRTPGSASLLRLLQTSIHI